MFDASKYSSLGLNKNLERKYMTMISDAIRVMNCLHFDSESMKSFKSGVSFSFRDDNGAAYRIERDSLKEALDYFRNGKSDKYNYARIHIDSDDKRVRCYLRSKEITEERFTHYVTFRDGKIVLVEL